MPPPKPVGAEVLLPKTALVPAPNPLGLGLVAGAAAALGTAPPKPELAPKPFVTGAFVGFPKPEQYELVGTEV